MQMKDRLPQLRGEIKTKAQGAVSGIYGISSQLSKEDIETLVKTLLRKAAFTFRVPEKVHLVYFTFVSANNIFGKRVGIFANEIFVLLLAQQWFDPSKKSSEGVGDYAMSFNPIPSPLIALIATAAHSGAGSQAHTRVSVSRTTILRRYTADTLRALLGLRQSSQLTFKNSAICSGRMLGM